jgi:hypothetical protein
MGVCLHSICNIPHPISLVLPGRNLDIMVGPHFPVPPSDIRIWRAQEVVADTLAEERILPGMAKNNTAHREAAMVAPTPGQGVNVAEGPTHLRMLRQAWVREDRPAPGVSVVTPRPTP